jgi:hypothetical protein
MGAPDDFQIDVARLALAAARDHGFALAGGQALIAHGMIDRLTHDIDLFTDQDDGVQAAADIVATALRANGFTVNEVPNGDDLGEVFYGFEQNLIEFEIHRDDQAVRLQLVRFDRQRTPSSWTSARCSTWTT